LEHKFNMDSLYRNGVQYISREEESQAVAKAVARAVGRQTQSSILTSIDVKETDHESLEFLKSVRRLVDNWLAFGDVDSQIHHCD
jgi:prophage antirepressor-like protein